VRAPALNINSSVKRCAPPGCKVRIVCAPRASTLPASLPARRVAMRVQEFRGAAVGRFRVKTPFLCPPCLIPSPTQ